MKIYTRTGDAGETGLFGGARTGKDSLRICTLGEIDELNACLGVAAALIEDVAMRGELLRIQSFLFDIGSEVASPGGAYAAPIGPPEIEALERSIDVMTEALAPLKAFILPGGSPAAAALHLARTVCRRAERSILALHRSEGVGEHVRAFVNRLSDWLFVAARTANKAANVPDVKWHSREER